MNCSEWQERIAQYAGSDLPWSEARAVEAHLDECPDCAELAALLAEDRDRLLRPAPELASVDFGAMRREMMDRIARRRRWVRWTPAVAVAAALVVAVAIPRHRVAPRTEPHTVAVVLPAAVPGAAEKPRPRPVRHRREVLAAAAPQVEMRLTTGDPDVSIILLPVTMESEHE